MQKLLTNFWIRCKADACKYSTATYFVYRSEKRDILVDSQSRTKFRMLFRFSPNHPTGFKEGLSGFCPLDTVILTQRQVVPSPFSEPLHHVSWMLGHDVQNVCVWAACSDQELRTGCNEVGGRAREVRQIFSDLCPPEKRQEAHTDHRRNDVET